MKTTLFRMICLSALIWTAISNSACSSLKTRDKNSEAVAKIRTAAVVAYTHDTPAAREIGLNLGSGKLEGSSGGSWQNQENPESNELFDKVILAFQKQMQWKVMDSKKMRANPAYAASYKQNMEGWHSRMPPNAGINRFLAHEIMDFDSARIMDKQGRNQLMKDLNVDSLIAVQSRVILGGTTVMGIGSRKPTTRITFFVYNRDVEGPIWFDTLEGQEMQSVGSTAFINETLMHKLALQSADIALAKLGQETEVK